MRKLIIRTLACFIPNKLLRRNFRARYEKSKRDLLLEIREDIKNVNYRFDILFNHYYDI